VLVGILIWIERLACHLCPAFIVGARTSGRAESATVAPWPAETEAATCKLAWYSRLVLVGIGLQSRHALADSFQWRPGTLRSNFEVIDF
jgi:hypothetical protein